MIPVEQVELPPRQQAVLARARRLAWITLAYIVTSGVLLFATMGQSQGVRANLFEDVVSAVPSLAFLVCTRLALRRPTLFRPYGLHSVVSVGYLVSALALAAMGLFLLVDSALKAAAGEVTTIGAVTLFGITLWAGWPMLAAIAWTTVPSVFLGRRKARLAPEIHDKILYADAEMMKADWLSGAATAIGVAGVGLGLPWLDPLAAALVSLDILHDGVANLRVAADDLMQRQPQATDGSGPDPLPARLAEELRGLDWVAWADLRVRETGHVFMVEAFASPRGQGATTAQVQEAIRRLKALDWRVHDVTLTLVPRTQET